MKKVLNTLLILVVVLITGFAGFVQVIYNKDYGESHPVPILDVEFTAELIAHGRYLANGPAHSLNSHAPIEAMGRFEAGVEVPVNGGLGLVTLSGKINSPNLTPDSVTGHIPGQSLL